MNISYKYWPLTEIGDIQKGGIAKFVIWSKFNPIYMQI